MKTLLIRWDLGRFPTYLICVDRSLARYIKAAIVDELEMLDSIVLKADDALRQWPAATAGAPGNGESPLETRS